MPEHNIWKHGIWAIVVCVAIVSLTSAHNQRSSDSVLMHKADVENSMTSLEIAKAQADRAKNEADGRMWEHIEPKKAMTP